MTRSSFLTWGYRIWAVREFAAIIGATELLIAVLIPLLHWSAKASAIGSAGAVLMFLTTLTMLFPTPGWDSSLGGFPALSGDVGELYGKGHRSIGSGALVALGGIRSH